MDVVVLQDRFNQALHVECPAPKPKKGFLDIPRGNSSPQSNQFHPEGDSKMNEATFEDAKELAQKLNLNKESVWEIIKGKRYSTPTELAMAVQAAFVVPEPVRR